MGVLLGEVGRQEEAIAAYDELARRFGEDTDPALREQVAMALVNKGIRLWHLDRRTDQIAVCDEIVARYGEESEPGMSEKVARALLGKSAALAALGRSEEAVRACEEIVRRYGSSKHKETRKLVKAARQGIAIGCAIPAGSAGEQHSSWRAIFRRRR